MLTITLLLTTLAASTPPVPADLDYDVLRRVPVQHNGRYAPLDTLAREVVSTITGREAFDGHDPVALLLAWQFAGGHTADAWLETPLVKVEHAPLKRQVGLDESRRRFSIKELGACEPLQVLLTTGREKQRTGVQHTSLEKQAAEIQSRTNALQAMLRGRGIAMVPAAPNHDDHNGHNHDNDRWAHPAEARAVGAEIASAWAVLGQALHAAEPQAFADASQSLSSALAEKAGAAYPASVQITRELRYNALRPFRTAWVLMVATLVVGLVSLAARRRWVDTLALVMLAVCFGLHTYGLTLRWQIAGRAPFANMYESLVIMAWGVELFALAFALAMRMRLIVVVAAGLGAAGLILADVLPLEATIGPIPPVLRNTAWLTVHVVTIMLAYGALALAMGVGHVQLGVLCLKPGKSELADRIGKLIYGIVLVGVLFLTAGIIFGAVWANASWGRYWGWDPKETWLLITLFVYLGMLHARYIGWLRQFGTAVVSILAFVLVVMTYYGVNYVLGVGLHSYGFGAGGVAWMLLYVGIQSAVLVIAAVRHWIVTRPDASFSAGPLATPALHK